ncbi:hypothetical protein Bca52824_027746 [Brassica carinata]|uniref:AB hydrolase-1 domain-containing protein n=1 Tax=Brassica carinata TaxID=52824 RepID=A0A8X7VB10_BRACI|nr:hypothetical protein Bca52824_027746 [Brassica carinata]
MIHRKKIETKQALAKNIKMRLVLVHGVCHGAWTWYKVKPLLEAAGHSVTAVDLAASGISTIKVEEIQSLKDYSKPLLEVLSSFGGEEKVIIVAHSMGGISAALAADIFLNKIAAIVFLTATMPDTKNPPTYAFEKDLELAKLLVRENPALAKGNLAGTRAFSEEGDFFPSSSCRRCQFPFIFTRNDGTQSDVPPADSELADPNDKSNEAANIVTPTKVVEISLDAGPSGTAEEDHRSMLHVDGDDGFARSDKSQEDTVSERPMDMDESQHRETTPLSQSIAPLPSNPPPIASEISVPITISPSVSTPAQSDPVGEETFIVPEVPAEDVTAPAQSDAQMGDEPTTVSEVQPEATMNQSPTPKTVMPSENREKNHGGEVCVSLTTPELPLRTTVDPVSQSTEEGQQSSPTKPDGFIRYSKRQRNSPERFNPDDPKWKLDGAKAPIWVDF